MAIDVAGDAKDLFGSSLVYFNSKDIFSLVAFVILIMIACIAAAVKSKSGINGFILANRAISMGPLALAMFLSDIGTTHFVGMAGTASRSGVDVYAYQLNATFILIALGWLFLPVYMASGSLTTMEYLRKRYGGYRLEVTVSVITLMLIVLTKTSVELLTFHSLLRMVFKNVQWWQSAVPITLAAVIITLAGGLYAIVYTSLVNFAFLVGGAGILSYKCAFAFTTHKMLIDSFIAAWPNTTDIHFGSNSTYKYTFCGVPSKNSWSILRPYDDTNMPWPGMVFGISILSVWYWCCDQLIVQVGLSAKSIIHAKCACLICGYMKITTFLFLILPGIVSRIFYTDEVACVDPDICERLCGSRLGCSDLAFPYVFIDVLSTGNRGLVLAGVLGCCLSSLTSTLNSGSTIMAVNIFPIFRSKASEMESLIVLKLTVVLLAVGSLVWMPVIMGEHALYNYVQQIPSIFAPPLAAIFIGGLFWERTTEPVAFQTLILGITISAIRFVWFHQFEVVPCGEVAAKAMPSILSNCHFLHFSIFVFVLCMCYIGVTGVFSEPINMIHLYRLLYWLRHSKLERVDLNDLNSEFQRIMKTDQPEQEADKESEKESKAAAIQRRVSKKIQANPAISTILCCIYPEEVEKMTKVPGADSEEVKRVTERVSITETTAQSKGLNLMCLILLLVSAVLWGYLA